MFTFLTDGPKDTSVEDAVKITFAPSLKTLEEEVMEKLGIQETRRQKRSYWYWPGGDSVLLLLNISAGQNKNCNLNNLKHCLL